MRRVPTFVLIMIAIGIHPAVAQEASAVASFLRSAPSARSWAMGQAGAAVLDPFVGYFNPGGLGVYGLKHPVGVVRSHSDWIPLGNIDIDYTNSLAFVSAPVSRLFGSAGPALSAVLAYHRQVFDVRGIIETTGDGMPDSIAFRVYDRSNNFTASLAFQHGIRVGVGQTMSHIKVSQMFSGTQTGGFNQEGTTTGWSYGVFAQLPLLEALSELKIVEDPIAFGPLTPEVTVTASYGWANRRGEITYVNISGPHPLPRLDRFGRAIELRLIYRDAPVIAWLATRDDVISKLSDNVDRHEGWEIELLGIVRLQKGDVPGPHGMETHGLSIHSGGVLRWITVLTEDRPGFRLPWYIANLDIFYRTAEVEEGSESLLASADFNEFGFTLNTTPLWKK